MKKLWQKFKIQISILVLVSGLVFTLWYFKDEAGFSTCNGHCHNDSLPINTCSVDSCK